MSAAAPSRRNRSGRVQLFHGLFWILWAMGWVAYDRSGFPEWLWWFLMAMVLIPAGDLFRRLPRRRAAPAALLCLMAPLLPGFWVPMPLRLLRTAVVATAARTLDVERASSGLAARLDGLVKTIWVNIVEYHGLAHLRRRAGPLSNAPPEVGERLVQLRLAGLNQLDVPHTARMWSTLMSGVGFCDQLNRLGAILLAPQFSRAQTYCMNLPSGDGHTLGRVAADGKWLYFDAWADTPAVFTLGEDGTPQVLWSRRTVRTTRVSSEIDAIVVRLYEATGSGWVLATYPPTLAQFWMNRIIHPTRLRTAAEPGIAGAAPDVKPVADCPTPVRRRIAREFVEARWEQLFGSEAESRFRYRQLASRASGYRDESVRPLIRAAEIFSEEPR